MEKQNKRDAILQIAKRNFSQKGYTETNLREIAKELNISFGLITYYFQNKKNIAIEILSNQFSQELELVHQYVNQDETPVLFSYTITKLHHHVYSSENYRKFYVDTMREDIFAEIIIHSGIDNYRAINKKYQLGYSDEELNVYGNYFSVGVERILALYIDTQTVLAKNLTDHVVRVSVGQFYKDEVHLEWCAIQSDQIVSRIMNEHPELLSIVEPRQLS